jgi:hypothetical protein
LISPLFMVVVFATQCQSVHVHSLP